jgi:hypothetical protein
MRSNEEQRWLELADKADYVFLIWNKINSRNPLADTFHKWYLRLIHERQALGLDTDTVWRLQHERENLRRTGCIG